MVIRGRRPDVVLEEVWREQEGLLRAPAGGDRASRLAQLFWDEAQAWEAVASAARLRMSWRAALAAREHAVLQARRWASVAAAFELGDLASAA